MKKLAYIMGAILAFSFGSVHAQTTTPLKLRSTSWVSYTVSGGTSTSTAPTTTNPNPELNANPPVRTAGTSGTVTTALHLRGCGFYWVTICAATGQTLSGGGTLQAYDWADFPVSGIGTVWSRSKGLDETVNGTGQCQTFLGHQATGADWLALATSSVTTSGGSTLTVNVSATCAY